MVSAAPSRVLGLAMWLFATAGNAALVRQAPFPAEETVVWIWDGASPPGFAKHLALVVEHLWLKDDVLLRRGRATSPPLAPAVTVTPVVHVEVDVLSPPAVPDQYREEMLHAVLRAAAGSTSGWVQLDYEAPPSHKVFFKGLVHEIRQRLPPGIKLSVTTLAWWCSAGTWLDELDADEVVPMFFKMGKDGEKINRMLRESPEKLSSACRDKSAGFALQESPPPEVIRRYARVYLFDYKGWKGK